MKKVLDLASPPDADDLFTILEVGDRARLDGRNDQPPASEECISGFQGEIVDLHRRLQDKARKKVEKLAARLRAATRHVDPSEMKERLCDIPARCRNNIDRVLADFDSRLTLLREQEQAVQYRVDDGEETRRENDLVRLASNGIVFLLMVTVTAATALALGSNLIWGADSESLLAVVPSTAIATLTVVAPFLLAVGVRSHIDNSVGRRKLAFRAAVFLVTVFLGLIALFCAHLIFLSSGTPAFTATDIAAAGNAMVADPASVIADVDSLKGLGVVMVMGFLGFLLGTQTVSADATGGDAPAAHLRICKERRELTDQLRRQINEIVDLAEREVESSMNRLQKEFKKLSSLVDQASDTQVLYEDFLAGLEESCNLLLERYRDANIAERNSNIPPSFYEQICFRSEGASRQLLFEDSIERYRQTEGEMKDLLETVAEVRRDLRDLNKKSIGGDASIDFRPEADEAHAEHTAFSAASG